MNSNRRENAQKCDEGNPVRSNERPRQRGEPKPFRWSAEPRRAGRGACAVVFRVEGVSASAIGPRSIKRSAKLTKIDR